ncbi:MAG: 23S rRNA (uracil(1939)-C(5))-methyltransferase RlmD [Candidatus Omnitrophota bacterium]
MNICKHFGTCGGCTFQDIPYDQQLLSKEEKVKSLMAAAGVSAAVFPINHYPPFYYRNKMEFTFSGSNVSCGLYNNAREKGAKEVFDVEECRIFSPDIGRIIAAVKEFAIAKGYTAYNRFNYQGFLRHLLVRQTKTNKQLMVGLVTTSRMELYKEEYVKVLLSLELESRVHSIYWIINDSMSDAVVFEKKELLYGEPFMVESLDDFKFNIGVDTFFQINPLGMKDLYHRIRHYASMTKEQTALDLFCGAGGIGMFLAQDAKSVVGVELQEAIVSAARANAALNNISNISFHGADVRRFLNLQGLPYKGTDVVVINPPRSGLSVKIVRAVVRLTPETIFYSSCNPETLFHDLPGFLQNYALTFVEPFDFFPHTPHMECLAVLKRAHGS